MNMMTEGDIKVQIWVMSFVNVTIYLNMTLSYRNNAGIVVCVYQCMISKVTMIRLRSVLVL